MIQVDRIASVFVAQPLLAAGLIRAKPGISILMYHSVSDDAEPGVGSYYRVTTSPARFADHMRWLHERGYAVIDLPRALKLLATGALDGERSIVITFDDGFRDFYTHAGPVLAQFGFTATMFLPTQFIGHTARSFKGRNCLTWREVRELRDAGMTFGSHTVTHPKLHGLGWTEIRRQLADSRATIEAELQAPVETFAYPYAFPQEDRGFVARFRSELAQQGYLGCVTTVIGRVGAGSDPLCLERLPVNQADDEALFTAKLSGAYDWLGSLQYIVRCARRSVKTGGLR